MKLGKALAKPLEFKAAKQTSNGHSRLRNLDARYKGHFDKQIGCWNCGGSRQIRKQCCKRDLPQGLSYEEARKGRCNGSKTRRREEKVGSLERGIDGFFVEGMMNAKTRAMLLDTEATRMIVRHRPRKARSDKNLPTNNYKHVGNRV